MLRVKRVYLPSDSDDGFRVLSDRLWPRGLSKEKAKIDLWAKDVAPTNELRTWYGHLPERWTEFRHKYLAELEHNRETVDELVQQLKGKKKVTLLFGAKDEEHNQAVVLHDYLASRLK